MAEKETDRFGDSFFEDKRLAEAVRNTQPSWLKDGHGIRSPVPRRLPPTLEAHRGEVVREPRQPFFPERPAEENITQVAGGGTPNIAFLLSNASETVDDVVIHKVRVRDGKINGASPAGMPSSDTYTLTVDDALTTIIFAAITFNPTSLAETSRYLFAWPEGDPTNIESRVESDSLGYLFWQLGFSYFEDDAFKIKCTRVGDINFAFSYIADNGKPALIPIDSGPGIIDLTAIFP